MIRASPGAGYGGASGAMASSSPPRRVFPSSLLLSARTSAQVQPTLASPRPGELRAQPADSPTRTVVVAGDDPRSPLLTTVTTHALVGGQFGLRGGSEDTNAERPQNAAEAVHHAHASEHARLEPYQSRPARAVVPFVPSSSPVASAALPRTCPLARASVHFEADASVDEVCANTRTPHPSSSLEPEFCAHASAFAQATRCAVVSSLNFVLLQPTLRTFWRQLSIDGQSHSAHVIPFSCPPPPALATAHGTLSSAVTPHLASSQPPRFRASDAPVTPTLHLLYFPSAADCATCANAHPSTVFPVADDQPNATPDRVRLEYSGLDRAFVVPARVRGQTETELLRSLQASFGDVARLGSSSSNARFIPPSSNRPHVAVVRLPRQQLVAAAAAPLQLPPPEFPTAAAHTLPSGAIYSPGKRASHDGGAERATQRQQDRFSASASMYHSAGGIESDPLTVSFLDHAEQYLTSAASVGHFAPYNTQQYGGAAAHTHQHDDDDFDLLSLTAPARVAAHRAALAPAALVPSAFSSTALSSTMTGRLISASPPASTSDDGSSPSSRLFCVLLPLLHHFDGPKEPLPPVDPRLCHESLRDLVSGSNVICPHQVAFVDLARILVVRASSLLLSPAPKTLLSRDAPEAEHTAGFWMFGQIRRGGAETRPSSDGFLSSSALTTNNTGRGFVVHALYFNDAPASADVCVIMFQNHHARNECLAAHPQDVYGTQATGGDLRGRRGTTAAAFAAAAAAASQPRFIDVLYSKRDGQFILPPRLWHALAPRYGSLDSASSELIFSLVHLLKSESTTSPRAFVPRVVEVTASQRIAHGLHPNQTHRITTTDKLEQTDRLAQSFHRLHASDLGQFDQTSSRLMGSTSTQPWLMAAPGAHSASMSSSAFHPSHSQAFASRSFSGSFMPSAMTNFSPRLSSSFGAGGGGWTGGGGTVGYGGGGGGSTNGEQARELAFRFHASAYPALISEFGTPMAAFGPPDVPLDHILAHLSLPRPSSDSDAERERRAQAQLLAAFNQDTGAIFRETYNKKYWWPCTGGSASNTRHAVETLLLEVDRAYRHRAGRDMACSVLRLDADATFAVSFLRCGRVQHARIVYDLEHGAFAGQAGRFRIMAQVMRSGDKNTRPPTPMRRHGQHQQEDADYIQLSDVTYASLAAIFPTSSVPGELTDGECTDFRFPPLVGTTRGLPGNESRAFEINVDESGHGIRMCSTLESAFPFAPLDAPIPLPVPHDAGPKLPNGNGRGQHGEEKEYEHDGELENAADEHYSKLRNGAGQRGSPKVPYHSVRGRDTQQGRQQDSALSASAPGRKGARLDFSPPQRGPQSTKAEFKARGFSGSSLGTLSPTRFGTTQSASALKAQLSDRSRSTSPRKHVRINSQQSDGSASPDREDSPSPSNSTRDIYDDVLDSPAPGNVISNLSASTVAILLEPHLRRNVTGDSTEASLTSLRAFLCELVWQALPLRERKVLTQAEGVAAVRKRIDALVTREVGRYVRLQVEVDEQSHLDSSAHRLISHKPTQLSPNSSPPSAAARSHALVVHSPLSAQGVAAASARLSPSQVAAVSACFGGDSSLAFEHLVGRTYFACTRNRTRVEEWLLKQRKDCTIVRMGSQEGTLSLSFVIAGSVQHIRLRFDVVSNYFHLLGHHETIDSHGAPLTVDLSMHYFATVPELVSSSRAHIYHFPPLWSPALQEQPKLHVPTIEELRQMRPRVLQPYIST